MQLYWHIPIWSLPSRREALRYVWRALLLGGVAYAILYFPYPPGSLPVRLLQGYLNAIAHASAWGVWLFDRSVVARGDLVEGLFSLRIVLDCAALDAHALFAAAVLAFPAPWRHRLAGVAAGTLGLAAVNVGRIVVLYLIGIRWPAVFSFMHEEVLQLAIVLSAFLAFLGWILWTQRRARA